MSITLWQPQRLVGATSHFLLPRRQRPAGPGRKDALDARYGDAALALMAQGLARHGVDARQCVACVACLFGGGDMFPDQPRHRARDRGTDELMADQGQPRGRRNVNTTPPASLRASIVPPILAM